MTTENQQTPFAIRSRWNNETIVYQAKEATTLGTAMREAALCGANLYEADLREAYLRGADLRGADLREANLREAYLRGANLSGANLSGANLYGANLYGADLSGANLYGANLSGANLYGANLRGADLCGADLRGADLREANLCGAKNAEMVIAQTRILPEGALIGWKKCKGGVIVKLRIPEVAKRSHAFGRKCRAEFAEVLEVIGEGEAISMHDGETRYVVGETVRPDRFSEDWQDECAPGIHFYITKAEAEAHS
jgi:hypothetical protein